MNLEKYRNRNGTYNGAALLADLSGLSEAEVRWTYDRMRALLKEGKPSAEAKAIVRAEAAGKPWESAR